MIGSDALFYKTPRSAELLRSCWPISRHGPASKCGKRAAQTLHSVDLAGLPVRILAAERSLGPIEQLAKLDFRPAQYGAALTG